MTRFIIAATLAALYLLAMVHFMIFIVRFLSIAFR